VLLIEVVLLFSGVISFSDGVVATAVVESTVFLVALVELVALRKSIKRLRSQGYSIFDAISASLRKIMPDRVATVVKHDLLMMRALWLVVSRRGDVPDSAEAVHYSRQVRPLFWVFFVLNPLEIALVELVVPWPALRLVLLIAGVLGTVWFLALIATLYKYPHILDARVLRLRYLSFFDTRIPIEKIGSVVVAAKSRSMKRSNDVVDDDTLVMEIMRSTNISLVLTEPHPVDLGARGVKEVLHVDFWVDDPRAAARSIDESLTTGTP